MPRERAWVKYVREKFGVTLGQHEADLDLDTLIATQSEIEAIKYHLVRHEAFREGERILIFKGTYGGYYIIDGHTRARVLWDEGARTVPATLLTSSEVEVASEMERIALAVGNGHARAIREVPVVDRIGKGTKEWNDRRKELLEQWRAELQADRGHGR